jgi:uncharacterized protein YbaR (Trm112 family)
MNSLTAQLSASQQREAELRELIKVLECPNCKGVGWYMQYVRDAEELEKVECLICADIAALSESTGSDFVRTEERDELVERFRKEIKQRQETQKANALIDAEILATRTAQRDTALAKLAKCREALKAVVENPPCSDPDCCESAISCEGARKLAIITLEETK